MKNKEAIILVHGIWMKGPELFYLRFKLWRQGYRVYQFHYPSLFQSPEQNAERLNRFVVKVNEPVIHFVAHSLGGIVVTHFLNKFEMTKNGKVVFMGTPINGSGFANHMSKNFILKYLLGKSKNALISKKNKWYSNKKLCVIAGTKSIGMGRVLARKEMQQQNDGTVNLDETRIEQADKFYVVPHSHFSMLWSADVSDKIKCFLRK